MADPNKLRAVPTFNPRAATPRAMAPAEPKMMTVKAKVDTLTASNGETYESPRVVYDMADMPIPHDQFVTTPMTASLVLALQAGDLELADEGTGDGGVSVEALSKMKLSAEFGGRPVAKEEAPQPEAPEPQPSPG